MTLTVQARELHSQLQTAPNIIKRAVSAAMDAAIEELEARGFDTAKDDTSAELEASIYLYLINSTKEDVICPQCGGGDKNCTYCKARGLVPPASADEWHRQNDPPTTNSVASS